MSKNIEQIYTANPITSNNSTDLMYFGRSPYGAGDDCGMTYANFAAQFGVPYTAAALTTANDTNITLTLGGTPATALLQAASITAGWTGQLAPARGGLGIATVPTNGQIPIGNGTNYTAATLTPGTGINITNASGSVTIATTGGAFSSSIIASTSSVSLTTATPANLTSLTLAAGDWDIWGNISFTPTGTTTLSECQGWISSTSATVPDISLISGPAIAASTGVDSTFGFAIPQQRFNLATSTTIYISSQATFGISTLTMCGGIYARRAV